MPQLRQMQVTPTAFPREGLIRMMGISLHAEVERRVILVGLKRVDPTPMFFLWF